MEPIESGSTPGAWLAISRELGATLTLNPSLRPLVVNPAASWTNDQEVPVDVVLTTLGLALAKAATAPIHALAGLDFGRIESLVAQLRHFEKDRRTWESKMLAEHDLRSMEALDQEMQMEQDLEAYREVSVWRTKFSGTSPIKKLTPRSTAIVGHSGQVGTSELARIFADSAAATERYVATRTPEMPEIEILRNQMGRYWMGLSSATRQNIVEEIRTTLVFWKIARPAIMNPGRPGTAQALTYGLQIPLKEGDEIPSSESGIEKSLKNLRASWAWLLARDCAVAQWAALYLSPRGTSRAVAEAIRAFASADTPWSAPSGRKSRSDFVVRIWSCDTCNSEFLPGDHTHDSPIAVKKRAAGEKVDSIDAKPRGTGMSRQREQYNLYHRVLFGLPLEAADWNRLMCANRDPQSGQPCWKRGGVLTPKPEE